MRWLFLISLFITTAVFAESEGQKLHDQSCLSCHDSMTNGKPEQIYTREDRAESSIEDLAGLQSRVEACASNAGAQWFDDETAKVVEYLNVTYYKFGIEEDE